MVMFFHFQAILQRAFYCVNTSYPMDNYQSVRHRPARQMTEKVALYVSIMNTQAGQSHCALARWRIVLPV